jgi:hypothetical protein
MQPTIINQIPVFNPLQTNPTCQSVVNVQQAPLQRATSFIIQQPQPQQLQMIQQQQPLQIIQQQQPLQLIQQPQQLQFIQNPQPQSGQFVQFASSTPQIIQAVQPQVLQTMQSNFLFLSYFVSNLTLIVPGQAIAGSSVK